MSKWDATDWVVFFCLTVMLILGIVALLFILHGLGVIS